MIGNELHSVRRLQFLGLSCCVKQNTPQQPTDTDDENDEETVAAVETAIAPRESAARALLDGIQANVSLQRLCISNNGFASVHEKQIYWYAALNRFGRYLLSLIHISEPTRPY